MPQAIYQQSRKRSPKITFCHTRFCMHYSSRIPPELKKNNFVKAQHSDIAVLQLVANLGHAEPNEVARLFSPCSLEWELKVGARALAYLVWLRRFSGEPATSDLRSSQVEPQTATALVLALMAKLTKTEISYLKKLLPKLNKSSRTTRVNPVSGMPLRYSELPLLTPSAELQNALGVLWPGWKRSGICRTLWQKLRAFAVKNHDSSALALARRRLARLLQARLLGQTTVGTNTKMYALTAAGAQYLGGTHSATYSRSSLKNLHKTLAKGVLLSELTRHTEGWSESSFYNSKHPGLLGSAGALTHKELFGSRPGSPLHPPDGVLLRPLSQDEKVYYRWPARHETFVDLLANERLASVGLTLIEAERGNKSTDEFMKSLLPFINGNSANGHVVRAYGSVAAKEGNWGALLSAASNSQCKSKVSPKEVAFVPSRLVYALESAEFLKPILNATWRFVQPKSLEASATEKGTASAAYARTGLKLEVLDDSPQAAELVLWHELLSFIEVNFCAVSLSGSTFLGVSARFSLADFAELTAKEEENER